MNPAGLVLVLGGAYFAIQLLQWIKRTPHNVLADYAQKCGLYLVIALLLILVLTGRLPLLLTLVGAVVAAGYRLARLAQFLPLVRQVCDQLGIDWPPFGAWSGRNANARQSTVQSRFVRMSLDHTSGELRGEILEGQFSRRWLNELSLDQLGQLLQECQSDPESVALVQSYIERVHGSNWQNKSERNKNSRGRDTASSRMSTAEAYEVLGLKPGASRQDIVSAHRRLMLKVHPDRGGSDYLAAKLNQAKDLLLG